MFIENGYHPAFIRKIRQDVEKKMTSPKVLTAKPNELFIPVQYSKTAFKEGKNMIRAVNRLLPASHTVKISYKTRKTADFFMNKDRVPNQLRSNIIYKYKCEECNSSYIGETTRHFITRIREHIKGAGSGSEVSHHIHAPAEKNFSIVMSSKYTKITESLVLLSERKEHSLNDFSSSYALRLFSPTS